MGNNSSKQLMRSAKGNNINDYDADEDCVQAVKRANEMRNRYTSSVEYRDLHNCSKAILDSDDGGDDGDSDGDDNANDDDAKESLISTNMDEDDIDDDQLVTDGLVNQIANLNCTEPLEQLANSSEHHQPQFEIVASECEVLSLSVQSELYALKLDQILTIRMCSSETSRLSQLKCCFLHCHPMTTISMVKQYVAFHTLLITDFHQLIDLELTGCKGIKLYNHFTLQFVQNSIWFKKCNRILEVISEEEEEDVAMAIENGQDYLAAIKEARSHQYMTLYYSIRNID